jgi:hypothetical protein
VGEEVGEGELAAPAPGLGDEAVEPFELEAAHPEGGTGGAAGDVVEDAADADADGDVEGAEIAVEPELLAGGAVGDEDEVDRAVGGDHLAHRTVVAWVGGAGLGADDDEAGVAAGQAVGGLAGDAGGGAEQVPAVAALGGEGSEPLDQIGAADMLAEAAAEEAGGDEEADAVRHVERGAGEYLTEARVPAGGHDELGVGGGDDVGAAFLDEALNEGDGLGVGDVVDGDAEDVEMRNGGHALLWERYLQAFLRVIVSWVRAHAVRPYNAVGPSRAR